MAKYRKISPRIWNDKKVRGMTDKGKLTLLFLLTHPHMTPLGAIRANAPGLACELGWTAEDFREAFREALVKGIVQHDEKACLIWFPRFLKHNSPESPNVVKSWAGAYDELPECPLKKKLLFSVSEYIKTLQKGFQEAFAEAFGEVLSKGMPNQEQEQEQEQDQETLTSFESLSSPEGEDRVPAKEKEAGEEVCPHQAILELYHSALPEHRRVRVLSDARKRVIKARWGDVGKRLRELGQAHGRAERLDWLRTFFARVAASSFLTGQVHSRDRPPFVADLDFLFSLKGFTGVIEGKYRDREET